MFSKHVLNTRLLPRMSRGRPGLRPTECRTADAPFAGEDAPDSLADANVRHRVQELYRAHAPSLVRQLARRTGCRELARELAQDAFVRLLRMTPATLARVEQPEAYVRRMSFNLLHDWGRSHAAADRSTSTLEVIAADQMVDQVSVLESRDTLRRLEAAVARMKPKTREIFLAHRIEGLTYAEIAERTGLSVKGVEKQMSKAIAKIDRLLDRR